MEVSNLFYFNDKQYEVAADRTALISYADDSRFPIEDNVIRILDKQDDFYEGSYLNRIKFIPAKSSFVSKVALWMINGGYLWEVSKQFAPGSTIVELGCAGGVDFFAGRYQMIGLDLSFQSLTNLNGYKYAVQADATQLPFADKSVDGIISSYFWEHIPAQVKDEMLMEFKRVVKPGGKLVFLYDVETDNYLISLLKKESLANYIKLFIEKDGHLGYETPQVNRERFEAFGFHVKKHFGMERTIFQSASVYEKFSRLKGWKGRIGKLLFKLFQKESFNKFNILFVRIVDATIGRFLPIRKSRIIMSVLSVD